VSEDDGRGWTQRVICETPRIAQLLFALPDPPKSSYASTGRYPDWIGAVTFERFKWTKLADGSYRADATALVEPGVGLTIKPAPPPTRAELTVDFTVTTTPPPVVGVPSASSLSPMRWTIHRVGARSVDESGGYVDYRE